MRRGLCAIVLVMVLLGLILGAGCPKKTAEPGAGVGGPMAGPPGGPGGPGATPPTTAGPAAGGDETPSGAALAQRRLELKSYIMSMTHEGQTMKQYVKLDQGEPVRMKMVLPGGQGYMLIMLDKKVSYLVDTQRQIAMKSEDKPGSKPEAPEVPGMPSRKELEEVDKQTGITWKSDTVDGVACWKMENPADSKEVGAVWLDKQYGLPRQVQSGEQLMKLQYESINAVPDKEFELPSGIKIVEGLEGMQGMPGR